MLCVLWVGCPLPTLEQARRRKDEDPRRHRADDLCFVSCETHVVQDPFVAHEFERRRASAGNDEAKGVRNVFEGSIGNEREIVN